MALATLTIDVNARLANIEKDLGKVSHMAEQSAQRMTAAFGAAQAAFASMAGALSVGAVVASIQSIIDMGDEINDLSQRIGISVKDLATWELAAKQSGTSLESVAKGVKGLSTFMVENGEALKKAGINATDANGALIQLADLFKAMPDGVEKTALAVKLFGKAGMDMIPMLNLGSAGLAEAAEKAKAYGERMALLAPQADKFNDELAEFALQSKIAGINITSYLLPGLTGIATLMNDVAAGGTRSATAMEFLAEKIERLVKGVPQLRLMAEELRLLAPAFAGIGETRSMGFTGEKDALGLPLDAKQKAMKDLMAFDAATDAYMREREARLRAKGLLGKEPAEKAARTGKSDLQRFLDLGQKNLNAGVDSEEEMRILAEKRAMKDATEEFAALQRMLKKGEENELAAYYETAGEETMRLVAEQQALKKSFSEMDEFAREAARGIQDAFAEFLFDPFSDSTASMLDKFEIMLRRMAAQAAAAQLSEKLFGDMGKTGKIGGLIGESEIGKSIGGWISGLFGGGPVQLAGPNADGNVFASGDLHRHANTIVSSPTLFKFAQGGSFGVMGEAGPEAIMPLKRGPNGKLGVQASGGGMTVVQHFAITGPADRRTQEQLAASAGLGIQRALARNT